MNHRHVFSIMLCAVCSAFSGVAAAQWTWTPETGRLVNLKNLPKETPELQYEHARSLLFADEPSQAWEETIKFNRFYEDSDFADENQYLRGEIRFAQEKYLDAAQEFQQVRVNYPGSQLHSSVIDKQYEIADTLFEKGRIREEKVKEGGFLDFSFSKLWYRWNPFRRRPLKQAIEVYEMVITNEPFTPQAAEAQYKIGLCHYTREEYQEAAYEYRRVMEDYPDSEWVMDAGYGLALTYKESALPPDYDQAPAELTVNAIDDFSKRFPTDPRVDELKPIRQDMEERIAEQRFQTAKFYEKRAEIDSARIYYELVVEQFPDTAAADMARAWLAENPPPETLRDRFLFRQASAE